jgi:hypothetical protein
VENKQTGGSRAIFIKKNVQLHYFWQPNAQFRLLSLHIVNKNLAQQLPTIWEILGKQAAQES